MNATEIVQNYVDVWNGRDAAAFLAVFTKGGTYSNPDTYPGIGGEALAAFVKGVATILTTLILTNPAMSVELFRYRGGPRGAAHLGRANVSR
jgi:SnoaL-like domain